MSVYSKIKTKRIQFKVLDQLIMLFFYILNIMKEDSNKKYPRYQNQSLMALTFTNQGQPTKKVIEPQDFFALQPVAHSNHRLYVFKLPLETEVASLVTAITTRFSNFVVHGQQDELGAEIILQGLQHPGIRAKIAKILDYFVFCCSKGLRFGKLEEVYNVIMINIKKQAIDHQCLVTVTNPYSQIVQKQMRDRYFHLILDPIQQQLKNILKNGQSLDNQTHTANPYLHNSSPTRLDMQIHKKIYDLFVLQDNKEYNRYKNIFLHSIQKIDKEIDQYRYKISNPTLSSKKAASSSTIIQAIIKETDSLLLSLKNTYKEDDTQQLAYLHSLLATQTAQTISFYTIEETLCLYRFKNLKEIYYNSISDQCESFNKQVEFLNKNKTDQECFEHLTLKKKYRLPDEKKPYYSAIQRLKLIEQSLSLRGALLVIQQTFSDVKTDCFVSHKGKVQLSSMDELLPVIIFVTVRASVKNFPIYVMMIGDYIRLRGVFQLQQRIMTAFYAAIEDVSRGWDLQETTKLQNLTKSERIQQLNELEFEEKCSKTIRREDYTQILEESAVKLINKNNIPIRAYKESNQKNKQYAIYVQELIYLFMVSQTIAGQTHLGQNQFNKNKVIAQLYSNLLPKGYDSFDCVWFYLKIRKASKMLYRNPLGKDLACFKWFKNTEEYKQNKSSQLIVVVNNNQTIRSIFDHKIIEENTALKLYICSQMDGIAVKICKPFKMGKLMSEQSKKSYL